MSRAFGVVRTWINDRFKSGQSRGPTPEGQRHIIFDMDETLVHTFEGSQTLSNLHLFTVPRLVALRSRLFALDKGMWGVTRPHLESMLRTAFTEFTTVTIWSAGEDSYVKSVVKRIFRGLPKPDLVMTREDCALAVVVDEKDATGEGSQYYKKPLHLPREYYERLGRQDVWMTKENTIIVEDTPSTIDSADRFNSVLIPPYVPTPTGEGLTRDDATLKTLSAWFTTDEFREAGDLRYVKRPVLYAVPAPKSVLRAELVSRRPVGYNST